MLWNIYNTKSVFLLSSLHHWLFFIPSPEVNQIWKSRLLLRQCHFLLKEIKETLNTNTVNTDNGDPFQKCYSHSFTFTNTTPGFPNGHTPNSQFLRSSTSLTPPHSSHNHSPFRNPPWPCTHLPSLHPTPQVRSHLKKLNLIVLVPGDWRSVPTSYVRSFRTPRTFRRALVL